MDNWLGFLFMGLSFGLAAGLSPGPLTALVISESLNHGKNAGTRVAISPLITDAPIVFTCVFLVHHLSRFDLVIASISILGSIYLGYLAMQCFRYKKPDFVSASNSNTSLKKGIIANLLSPHPWLFWTTVGGVKLIEARQENILSAGLFLLGMYLLLIGSKIVIAWIIGSTRQVINLKIFVYINYVLGAILLIFGFLFIKQGIKTILNYFL